MKKLSFLFSVTFILCALVAKAQNVGIGTNTPAKKLEINSGILNQSGLRLTQYASTATEVNVTDVVAEIPSVTGLAFDNSGNCYATNFSGNKIHKISPAGIVTDFVTTNLNGPHDIILGPDGNLYVSNYFGGNISKITLSGVITTFASGFSNPIGLAFDMNNFLFVVNNGNGQLSKVSPTGAFITYNFGTGLTSPYGCVYSASNDKIYISNYGANEIAEINFLLGGAKTTFKAGVDACTGINIDASANIYAAQAAPNKVVKITQGGVVTDYATTTYPFDITFNDGKLYMANQTTNKVSVLNAVSNFLAVDNKGDVVRINAGKLLPPSGQAFGSWLINGNNISNNNTGNVGIGDLNPTKAKLIVNSNTSTNTNAVFGSNGAGISLQKDNPFIGYNCYSDANNSLRYMASGQAMGSGLDQLFGNYFWNGMGSGLADGLVGTNEKNLMTLNQAGLLTAKKIRVNEETTLVGETKIEQGKITTNSTGSNNMLPIAWGHVNADGTLGTGSGNFTVDHAGQAAYYYLHVNGYLDQNLLIIISNKVGLITNNGNQTLPGYLVFFNINGNSIKAVKVFPDFTFNTNADMAFDFMVFGNKI